VVDRGRRIVEEHHQPIAREVLDGALLRHDDLADRLVVLAENSENLLRLGSLCESRETPQVTSSVRCRSTVWNRRTFSIVITTKSANVSMRRSRHR
jgi:predicted ABC-class ATPase